VPGTPGSTGQDLDQAVGGDRLGTPLERQQPDRLAADRVSREALSHVAEQDLADGCGRLQSLGDVDRVTRRVALPVGRVDCDHLAGVDADAYVDAEAVRRLQLAVQLVDRLA